MQVSLDWLLEKKSKENPFKLQANEDKTKETRMCFLPPISYHKVQLFLSAGKVAKKSLMVFYPRFQEGFIH